MHDELHPSSYHPRLMRDWWSARSRAKVWDAASARAFKRPASAPVEMPTADAKTPGIGTTGAPTTGALGASTLAELFEPRPNEQIPPVALAVAPAPMAQPPGGSDAETAAEATPVATPVPSSGLDSQAEFLRLLEVVTSMCDHVIEYIEADRAERQQMMDTLADLGRVITEGAATAIAAMAAQPAIAAAPATDLERTAPEADEPRGVALPAPDPGGPIGWRERVIGGSVAPGPEPHLDLVHAESEPAISRASGSVTEIAVEVRGRFGDRWVDGFEICEVMTTPSGPRYRLRRQRDGVVLPELFDASNIRHVETLEQTNGEQTTGEQTTGEQTTGEQAGGQQSDVEQTSDEQTVTEPTTVEQFRRERSMGLHPSGSDPGSGPVSGSTGYWSRS
jgi:hypothetical protein